MVPASDIQGTVSWNVGQQHTNNICLHTFHCAILARAHERTNGTCSALDGLDLVLPNCVCAGGFAYLHVSRLDEGAAEAPREHLSRALAVLLEFRSGGSSASSRVVHVDVEDRREINCSQGTRQSAAARAWRHAQIGATALISRSAAPSVSDFVPPTGAKRLLCHLGMALGRRVRTA